MICFQRRLIINTRPRSFHDLSPQLADAVKASEVRTGMLTVFVQHTSASLVIQENADPAVRRDLARWMADVAPESRPWEHGSEGADDMPAHARSAITRSSESIPVTDGKLALGTWQGVFLWEHRSHAHQRVLIVHVTGTVE